MKRFLILPLLLLSFGGCSGSAAPTNVAEKATAEKVAPQTVLRPFYNMNLAVDYAKLTFTNSAQITVPVAPNDNMKDVSFFIYANADGVGGAGKANPNITIESVSLNAKALKFSPVGAVLKIQLPQPQNASFTLKIKSKGHVPLAPAGSEGLGGMLSGIDLGSLLGGQSSTGTKPKNQDYGLYTFGNNILSLGAFWYPTLAIRKGGKWLDSQPEGLGDVSYAETSDYEVKLTVTHDEKNPVLLSAPTWNVQDLIRGGVAPRSARGSYTNFRARDFPILLSDQYQTKSKSFDVAGKPVEVRAFTTKANAAKADAAIEIAGRALQIYSKRFGAYNYSTFTVAEAPIRGGAGGMEYSGMTGIASLLYGDLGAQLGGLANMIGGASNDKSSTGNGGVGDVISKQKAILDSLFEETIAHEVAHQWWAIGVGSDSAQAPWLDESLTNYSSMIYWKDRYGKARAQQMSDAHLKSSYAFARMLGAADARVDVKSAAYANGLQYGAVVYGKGALFYGALRKLVGEEKFFAALREYYARFNGKIADRNSLRDIFKTQSPEKAALIEALYVRWIESAHGDADITNGRVMTMGDLLGGMLG